MKPSEQIREIWMEMRELKMMRDGYITFDIANQVDFEKRRIGLEKKYEEINILFGNESSFLKAIVYYLDKTK